MPLHFPLRILVFQGQHKAACTLTNLLLVNQAKQRNECDEFEKPRVSVKERYYKLDAEENKDGRPPSPDMHQTPSHIHIEEKRQYPP